MINPIYINYCNGSFGELLQGERTDNKKFLVNLPIDAYSRASFIKIENEFHALPTEKWKIARLAQLIEQNYNLKISGLLTVHSLLPVGKGLSSSTADLAAVAKVFNQAYKLRLSKQHISNLIAKVGISEASDGVMYGRRLALFDRSSNTHCLLGAMPKSYIIAIDEGGEINTEEYHLATSEISQSKAKEYEKLLASLLSAIQNRDIKQIGAVATESAILNQEKKKISGHFFKIKSRNLLRWSYHNTYWNFFRITF